VKDLYNIDRIILCDTTTAVICDAMTPKRAYIIVIRGYVLCVMFRL